jgi:hypothetical protein
MAGVSGERGRRRRRRWRQRRASRRVEKDKGKGERGVGDRKREHKFVPQNFFSYFFL